MENVQRKNILKLSIITINYNGAVGLERTIKSVINQTCCDFDYIVIDGGSTDGSLDVIKHYADRIDFWLSESDKGIYNAMNKGVGYARGEYCLFLNGGDWLADNDVIKDIFPFLEKASVITGILQRGNEICIPAEHLTLGWLYQWSVSHQASFIKTDLLKKYPYDETLKIVSDWKFWLQTLIADNETYQAINRKVAFFDMSGISSSQKALVSEERTRVIRDFLPPRILDDYRQLLDSCDGTLYMHYVKSKHRQTYYKFNQYLMYFLIFVSKITRILRFK